MAKQFNDNREKDIKSDRYVDESDANGFNNHSYLKLIKNLGSRYAVDSDKESEKHEDKQNDYLSHRKRGKRVGIEY